MDVLVSACTRQGCQQPARWRPVIYVPLMDAGNECVAVELPIQLCTSHRLPQHGWDGLTDPGVIRALRRKYGEAVLIDRAWIHHRALHTHSSA